MHDRDRLTAILLDVDGTLLLSNDAHARAWRDAFAAFGYDVALELLRSLIGMGGEKVIAAAVPELGPESNRGKAIAHRRGAIFLETYLPGVKPAPGARPLLERLRDDGVRRVVATSAKDEELRALLEAAGIDDLVEDAATSDDAARSKPDPDIVHAALVRAKVAARDAVMLGDTPYDVAAAEGAGVSIIAVRCGGWDDEALRGAAAVYDDPGDVLAHYRESPLARVTPASAPPA
jgi:HAD superfamily hydrolase (TIGR01509 family)